MTTTTDETVRTFTFPKGSKLHLAANKEPSRYALHTVSLHKGHLIATTGKVLAIVPVDSQDGFGVGDEPVLLPASTIKAATTAKGNGTVSVIGGEARAAGTVAPIVTGQDFPRIAQLVESAKDQPIQRTIRISARQLWDLAQALGAGKDDYVDLAIPGDKTCPHHVTNPEVPGSFGLIMPIVREDV